MINSLPPFPAYSLTFSELYFTLSKHHVQCNYFVPDLETSRIGLKIRCKIHVAYKVWLGGGGGVAISQTNYLQILVSTCICVCVCVCVCITEAHEMCWVISVSELFMFVSFNFVDAHRSYLLPPPTWRNIQFHALA